MHAFRHSTGAQRRLPAAAHAFAACAPLMYACGYTFGTLTARSEWPSSMALNGGHGASRPSGSSSTSDASQRSMQKRSSTFAVSGGHASPALEPGNLPSETEQSPQAQKARFGLPRVASAASRPCDRRVDGLGVMNMARVVP